MVVMAHALGRVESIRATLDSILRELGPRPARFVMEGCPLAHGGKEGPRYYRFFNRSMLSSFLAGLGRALRTWGSLEQGLGIEGDTWQKVDSWLRSLRAFCPSDPGMLLPRALSSSALKRPMLFLRWMVRSDAIDPGGWTLLRPAELAIPLDTHLFRWARERGLITRRQPDRAAARQLTDFFRELVPDDPCRYDFSLAQLGMHRARGQKTPAIL